MNALEIVYLANALKPGNLGDKEYFSAFGAQPLHDLAKLAATEGLLVEIMSPDGLHYIWPRYTFPSLSSSSDESRGSSQHPLEQVRGLG